jgi:hypothetical protein
MKHLKSYNIFESKEEIDYVSLILANLSDTTPYLIGSSLDDRILLYDLNINNKDYDVDEMESTIGRLDDEGWTLLNVCRGAKKISYDTITSDDTIYCSIIRTDLLNEIKSKGIKIWSDLDWKDWNFNKSTNSQCSLDPYIPVVQMILSHAKFVKSSGDILSVIDGTGPGNNYIDWIEIYDSDDGYRFSNPVEAEIKLIELQY